MKKYLLLLAVAGMLASCGGKETTPTQKLNPTLTPYLGDCGDEIDMSTPMAAPMHITKEGEQDLRNYVVYNCLGEHQLRIVYHVAEPAGTRLRMDASVTGSNLFISYTVRNTPDTEEMCEYPMYFDYNEFPYFDYTIYIKNKNGVTKEAPLKFQLGYGPDTIFVD